MPRDINDLIADADSGDVKDMAKFSDAACEAKAAVNALSEALERARKNAGPLMGAMGDLSPLLAGLAGGALGAAGAPKPGGGAKSAAPKGGGAKPKSPEMGALDKQIKSLKSRIDALKLAGKDVPIQLDIEMVGLEKLDSFMEKLPESEQAAVDAAVATKGLGGAVDQLADKYPGLVTEVDKAVRALAEEREQAETLRQEQERQGTLIGKLEEQFKSGSEEAANFGGGLAQNATGLMAVGVAAVFVAQKVNELVESVQQSVVEFAEWRTEMGVLARTPVFPGGAERIEVVRDELSMTTSEFKDFSDIVREGSNQGVLSLDQMTEAALRLRSTFGGAQLDRLREFVDLTRMIPTLETDLAVTASMDDQAAAAFALAQEGKVESVIELQAAGLLGGIQLETDRDVELLNSAQKTEKFMEDIDMWTKSFFPTFTPQIAEVSGGILKVVGWVAGLAAAFGAFSFFMKAAMGTQIGLQKGTMLAAGGLKMSTPFGGSGGGGGLLAKLLGGATGGVVGGLAVAALGVAVAYAGTKVTEFGDTMVDEGEKVEGSLTKLGGAATTLAGTMLAGAGVGTAIGALGGPITAAGGALVGGLVGMAMTAETVAEAQTALGEALQGQIEVNGKVEDKYRGWVKVLGRGIEEHGEVNKRIVEATKDVVRAQWEETKSRWEGVKAFARWTATTEKHREAIAEREKQERMAAQVQKEVNKVNEALADAIRDRFERQQESMFALQKAIKRNEAEFGTMKTRLAEANQELAVLRLDRIVDFGGTMESFDRAMDASTDAVSDHFGLLTEAAAKRREQILRDGKLSAQDRESALNDLHKRELEAVNQFVDGMNEAIGRMLETPDVILSALQRQLREARVDVALDVGAVEAPAALGVVGENFGAIMEEVDAIVRNIAERDKMAERRAKELQTMVREQAKTLREGFEDIEVPDFTELKKRLKEGFEKGIGEAGEILDEDAIVKPASEIAKRYKKAKEALREHNREMEEMGLFAPGPVIEKLREEQAEATKAFKDLEALAERRKEAANIKDVLERREKLQEIEDAEKEIRERQVKRADDMLELQRKLNARLVEVGFARKGEELTVEETLKRSEIVARESDKSLEEQSEALRKWADRRRLVEEERRELQDHVDQLGKLKQFGDPAVALQKDETQRTKDRLEETEKLNELMNEGNSVLGLVNRTVESAGKSAQERLGILEAQADVQAAYGNVAAHQVEMLREQDEIWNEQLAAIEGGEKTLEGSIPKVRAGKERAEEQVRLLKEQNASREKIEAAEAQALRANTMLRTVEEKVADLRRQRAEIQQGQLESLEVLRDGMVRFNDTALRMKELIERTELGEIRLEAAQFMGVDEGLRAVEDLRRAAREVARERRQEIERLAEIEKSRAEKRARALEAEGRDEEARLVRLVAQRRKEVDLARNEVDMKKRVVELAHQERDMQMEMVDIEGEGIEAQIGFLEEMGAPFGTIFDLQKQSLLVEERKLELARENLAALEAEGVKGPELERARLDVMKQGFALQQKALGAQRSAYEELLGLAFGEIREARGARKFLTSDIRLLGKEATRVRGRAGFLQAGESRTIQERVNEMQLQRGRAGGAGLMGGAPGALLGQVPQKLEVDLKEGEAEIVPGAATGGAPAGRGAGAAAGAEAVGRGAAAEVADRLGLPAGAAAAEEEALTVNVTGEVTVHFDSDMFHAAVVQIVTTDPEITDKYDFRKAT